MTAAAYVVVDGIIYSPTGTRHVDEAALISATPVLTALGTGTDPISLPAYRVTNEPENAVLRTADGSYLGLSAITRTFGRKRFVLESGTILTAYGQWPMLPARFTPPSGADGAPAFSFFGKDDIGARIYVPAGGQPTEGFAVAPGSTPDDPAAGNPNWTWWRVE